MWYERDSSSVTEQQNHEKKLVNHNLNQMSRMDTQSFVVRVQFQNKTKFLELKENDLDWKTFIDKGNSHKQFMFFLSFILHFLLQHSVYLMLKFTVKVQFI